MPLHAKQQSRGIAITITTCTLAGGRYRFLLLRKPSAMHPCVSQPYFLYEVTSNPMLSSDNVHYS